MAEPGPEAAGDGQGTWKGAGFPGWLTMESKATEKPEQALRRAPAYIRKQWAEA